MSNFECIKRLGIRLKDRNGNTILNRLIDQYNIPALITLIQMDSGIKTFRNNRNQTPQEYIKSLLKIIADKYDANTLKSRIIKYGYILMSYLEPTALTNVDLELYTSEEFIVTIIKYNICMFNEFLWFHMLKFNNFLTMDELMAVLKSMGFVGGATGLTQLETSIFHFPVETGDSDTRSGDRDGRRTCRPAGPSDCPSVSAVGIAIGALSLP